MDFLITFAAFALVVLIALIVAYAHNTNSIIRVQEKQIARLRTDNMRLQAALTKAQHRQVAQVIDIHDSRIDPENIPEFNNI